MTSTEFNLFAELGFDVARPNRVAIYVADKDRHGKPVKDYEKWVADAGAVLASLQGGGATVIRNLDGYWVDRSGECHPVDEKSALVYSFVSAEGLREGKARLREFIDRLGIETNQGEIAMEFNGKFATKKFPERKEK